MQSSRDSCIHQHESVNILVMVCTTADNECMAYEHTCANGQCVPAAAKCNGTVDCLDGSDELKCPCKRDEFTCRNGNCINIALRCDGQENCLTGEDELNCGKFFGG